MKIAPALALLVLVGCSNKDEISNREMMAAQDGVAKAVKRSVESISWLPAYLGKERAICGAADLGKVNYVYIPKQHRAVVIRVAGEVPPEFSEYCLVD